MAEDTLTTRPGAVEAPLQKADPFASHFVALLNALSRHIRAEQALDATRLDDPAYGDRQDRADAARLQVYTLLAELTGRRAAVPAEVPLRRMVLVLAVLLREGTASAFRRYGAHKADIAACLTVPGDGPIEARIRHLLRAADLRIARMAGLALYRQDGAMAAADAEPLAA